MWQKPVVSLTLSELRAKEICRESHYYSRNVKLPSAITPFLENVELYSLRTAWGFLLWRIECCDRHLYHVTGSDTADTPFYRRWPRFPRGCGTDMEQLVEISHVVIFTGVF